MIVADEHLQDEKVLSAFSRWYRGKVCSVIELRPGTVVKDDAIPGLLRRFPSPTFVTLNWRHFWERVEPHPAFCIVCLTLTTQQVDEVPPLLRRLFSLTDFKTKAARMGKVVRISGGQVTFRAAGDPAARILPLR